MAFSLSIYGSSVKPTIWFVGDAKPNQILRSDYNELSADNMELEYIRTRFDNIPIAHGHICTWVGEMANFILKNL